MQMAKLTVLTTLFGQKVANAQGLDQSQTVAKSTIWQQSSGKNPASQSNLGSRTRTKILSASKPCPHDKILSVSASKASPLDKFCPHRKPVNRVRIETLPLRQNSVLIETLSPLQNLSASEPFPHLIYAVGIQNTATRRFMHADN